METFLVAYDIANPKRLRTVARACEDFGLRRLARLDVAFPLTRKEEPP